MKKAILLIIVLLTTTNLFGQVEEGEKTDVQTSQNAIFPVTYQLFPTQNRWTFIKLNTRNGKMWQVQYDIEGENRFETYLNQIPLVEKEKEVDNRFTLYSTQNIWTFILLDQVDGRTWQVQWSIEPEGQGMWMIK
ncbi:MAG: hypothetical protein U5L96_12035 [Owenweeksia sp.]|nr:hypothetical protein [Owenweeksia sp.]